MEWLEKQEGCQHVKTKQPPVADVVNLLKAIFYGSEENARAFLDSIRGMKPTQITDKVNQLVGDKQISELSKHRDLWKVLHDCGIYTRSESNWNMQVK
jgi:hypothetical protein